MKPLPLKFQRGEYTYTQIDRSGSGWCIYRRERENRGEQWFEVVKARRKGDSHVGGKTIEAHESYPRDEDWGTFGFTCDTKQRAFAKLEEMLNRRKCIQEAIPTPPIPTQDAPQEGARCPIVVETPDAPQPPMCPHCERPLSFEYLPEGGVIAWCSWACLAILNRGAWGATLQEALGKLRQFI